MRAMVVRADGDTGTLVLEQLPDPRPGPTEVVIEVMTSALNRSDLKVRAGLYQQSATARPGSPVVAGLECAGTVVARGHDVTRLREGDRVMTMCSGGYADFVAVDQRVPVLAPRGIDWEQAAALPVGLMTELDALRNAARLESGEAVLITAGGAGVGLVGVQVARLLGAGLVVATVRGERQQELALAAGADIAINSGEDHADDALRAALPSGPDVVIDHVGASTLGPILDLMALRSRLVSVGRMGGTVTDIDLDLVARKLIKIVGVTFRTRTLDEYGAIADAVSDHLIPAVAAGAVRVPIRRTYRLEEALVAQQAMMSEPNTGKIVLKVADSLTTDAPDSFA